MSRSWASAHGCDVSGQADNYPTSFDGRNQLNCRSYSRGCTSGVAPVVDCRFNGECVHAATRTQPCTHTNAYTLLHSGGHQVLAYAPDLMWEFFSKHVRDDTLLVAAEN